MAKWRAIPGVFGKMHPRYLTPTVSTIGMGVVSAAWTAFLILVDTSGNVLNDSITAIGFSICFYYGFTGLACGWYFRKELFKSVPGFLLAGLAPVVGGVMMGFIFVKAFIVDSGAGYNNSAPVAGVQIPILIGIGALLLGIPLMIFTAFHFREYFRLQPRNDSGSRSTPRSTMRSLHTGVSYAGVMRGNRRTKRGRAI